MSAIATVDTVKRIVSIVPKGNGSANGGRLCGSSREGDALVGSAVLIIHL